MNNPFTNPEEKCCMCVPDFDSDTGWKCRGLNMDVCPGECCSSYKTTQQKIEDDAKTKARIMSLPKEQREYIIMKYGMPR